MNPDELAILISGGESETLELKRSTSQITEACQSLCALLNNRGGFVILGVESDGRITGQTVSDDTLRKISAHLQKFEPSPPVQIEQVPLQNGLAAIVLDANWVATSQPFTYDDRPYQRVGSTTQRMPQLRYQNLLLQRAHPAVRWENTIAEGYSVNCLDLEEVSRTAAEGVNAQRMPFSDMSDPLEILHRLGLTADGSLKNAAMALFLAVPTPDFPQFHLRMARFRGSSKAEFIDSRQIHGNAFTLLREAILFLERHLPVSGRIVPGLLERVDEPLIPFAALREALINAICHRDYAIPGGSVSIAIYDERLEILNDGSLPEPLRIEDLTRDHASRPRNPIIAEVFYRRGLIERWGRGTQRIVEMCVEAGLPVPTFFEQAGTIGIRFDLRTRHSALREQLSERQLSILRLIQANGATSTREIIGLLEPSPSRRTVQLDLAFLQSRGLIEAVGQGPTTRYRLTEQGRESRS